MRRPTTRQQQQQQQDLKEAAQAFLDCISAIEERGLDATEHRAIYARLYSPDA
jgi:hypothetical protein